MNSLRFCIHLCGMGQETFTDQIMIYKPHTTITNEYTISQLSDLSISTVSELIAHIKVDPKISDLLGSWGMEYLTYASIYVRYADYMLRLLEDKAIADMFGYFGTNQLELAFFIVGGASLHNEWGYSFKVHSDEKIHEHMPHVHVEKGGVEFRYSLETLQAIDLPLTKPHKHEEKKHIIPFLKKNQSKLLEMWYHNLNGYSTPVIREDGAQFYPES